MRRGWRDYIVVQTICARAICVKTSGAAVASPVPRLANLSKARLY